MQQSDSSSLPKAFGVASYRRLSEFSPSKLCTGPFDVGVVVCNVYVHALYHILSRRSLLVIVDMTPSLNVQSISRCTGFLGQTRKWDVGRWSIEFDQYLHRLEHKSIACQCQACPLRILMSDSIVFSSAVKLNRLPHNMEWNGCFRQPVLMLPKLRIFDVACTLVRWFTFRHQKTTNDS